MSRRRSSPPKTSEGRPAGAKPPAAASVARLASLAALRAAAALLLALAGSGLFLAFLLLACLAVGGSSGSGLRSFYERLLALITAGSSDCYRAQLRIELLGAGRQRAFPGTCLSQLIRKERLA
jgi:hypothetical protein